MHHDSGHGRQIFYEIISVGYGVHAVLHRAIESKQFRCIITIQRISSPSQRTSAQRAVIHALCNVMKS